MTELDQRSEKIQHIIDCFHLQRVEISQCQALMISGGNSHAPRSARRNPTKSAVS
jgi:hypothetical protein